MKNEESKYFVEKGQVVIETGIFLPNYEGTNKVVIIIRFMLHHM